MQQKLPFPKDSVVVSLSGGMDSSTLLLRCLKEYKNVTAISFDYGQKHRVELERAQSLVNYIIIAQHHLYILYFQLYIYNISYFLKKSYYLLLLY